MLVAAGPASNALSAEAFGYYQQTLNVSCNNMSICYLNFPPIPSPKNVVITNVNCRINANGTATLYAPVLGTKNSGGANIGRTSFIGPPVFQANLAGVRVFVLNGEVLHVINATQIPFVAILISAATSAFSAQCSIGGEIQ
jgi:hypothetical protein